MADLSGDDHESRSGGDDRLEIPDLNDKPTYLLEHLATFTVNKESGILYPADGMRRLLQLEKTTGIWSQKMQLCLDYQWVLIMDYETGNIIERFPASLIQEPTAFTSTDAMELYNNILVFIVSGGNGSRSEMHIFQSQNVSAVHLVEDLKQLRIGKVVTKQRELQTHHGGSQIGVGHRASLQHSQHHSHQHTVNQHQQSLHHQRSANNAMMEHYSDFVHKSNMAAIESESEIGVGGAFNDETSSTTSDKYERDVTVLNHCFDDIEKFIARLQHAAAASRELERRRRNRKSKKRDPGEGLLTLRTRPPHEKEFIDIFAKFKLSFNLLAKLKAHIHDPNAPELVHFLFTPLALIVEAASDTYYDAQIPAHVVNPLLTREAINLLINCVTSKETELWRSLGEAWTVPRDQWKDEIGSYHPVFLDGWSPDYLVVDEPEQIPVTPVSNSKRQIVEAATVHNQHNADFNGGNGANVDFSNRSEISIDSIERSGLGAGAVGGPSSSSAMMQSLTSGIQNLHTTARNANSENNNNYRSKPIVANDEQALEAWLDDLHSVGAKVVVVTYPRTANNDKELSVVRGEYLEVLDDTRKWWKARNLRGQIAHVPHTIVAPYNYGDSSPNSTQFYGQQQQQQQSFKESVEPRSVDTTDWIRKKHLGTGHLRQEQSAHHEYAVPMKVTSGSTASKPPLTKPENVIADDKKFKRNNRTNGVNNSLSMQDELRHVLHMRLHATPSVFIDKSSGPEDVKNWLVAKEFSSFVTQSLAGLSGEDLFLLTPKHIEDQFGIEGRRLNSQIKLQRSVSGYKTSRTLELEAVLKRNRPAININEN